MWRLGLVHLSTKEISDVLFDLTPLTELLLRNSSYIQCTKSNSYLLQSVSKQWTINPVNRDLDSRLRQMAKGQRRIQVDSFSNT